MRSAAAGRCRTATKTIDFTPPWQRAKYGDLFREHVGCDMDDEAAVRAAARARRSRSISKRPRAADGREGPRRARA